MNATQAESIQAGRTQPLRVVLFGGSACTPDQPDFATAGAIGRAVARQGWTLVNGGYGGTMLASAQGAVEAGGRVIGVACSIFRSAPSACLHETLWTDNLFDRMRRLIELGDAYVCLPGSTGTLAELAMVWELMNKRQIPVRPLICWGAYWRPVVSIFDGDPNCDPRVPALANLRERRGELIRFVDSVEELVRAIAEFTPPAD